MIDEGFKPEQQYETLRNSSVETVRKAIRNGEYRGHTAGLGKGRLQCNLVILSEKYAIDFFRFCQRNPKPCPLVGVSETGNPMMKTLGADIDIRTDVPGYIVYREGLPVEEKYNIIDLWQDDFVAFALGCSFTFEHALMKNGIELRHIETNLTVPMYRTAIKLIQAGPFYGETVVSMRPIPKHDVEHVTAISRKYPYAHGAPIHVGNPEDIGIANIKSPDWGNAVDVREDEVPMFWACGVTPQNVLAHAKPTISITHKPGLMLITDVPENAEIPVLSQQ
ncbi:MAG: putative hydro-lyase [Halopseudomonas aestusnigri]